MREADLDGHLQSEGAGLRSARLEVSTPHTLQIAPLEAFAQGEDPTEEADPVLALGLRRLRARLEAK
jgi:hypothetical protein